MAISCLFAPRFPISLVIFLHLAKSISHCSKQRSSIGPGIRFLGNGAIGLGFVIGFLPGSGVGPFIWGAGGYH